METLQLALIDGPSLKDCEFKIKETAESDDKTIECGYVLSINTDNDEKIVTIGVGAASDSENIPFSFDVKAEASFRITTPDDKKYEGEKFEKKAIMLAWPYLFIFLKEVVSDLTKKANLPPFNLPPTELDLQKLSD